MFFLILFIFSDKNIEHNLLSKKFKTVVNVTVVNMNQACKLLAYFNTKHRICHQTQISITQYRPRRNKEQHSTIDIYTDNLYALYRNLPNDVNWQFATNYATIPDINEQAPTMIIKTNCSHYQNNSITTGTITQHKRSADTAEIHSTLLYTNPTLRSADPALRIN